MEGDRPLLYLLQHGDYYSRQSCEQVLRKVKTDTKNLYYREPAPCLGYIYTVSNMVTSNTSSVVASDVPLMRTKYIACHRNILPFLHY